MTENSTRNHSHMKRDLYLNHLRDLGADGRIIANSFRPRMQYRAGENSKKQRKQNVEKEEKRKIKLRKKIRKKRRENRRGMRKWVEEMKEGRR